MHDGTQNLRRGAKKPLPGRDVICYEQSLSSQNCVSVEEIRSRLREAAQTLRRLPRPKASLSAASLASGWPDVVQEWLAYGWTPVASPRIPPAPEEISRLDEALGWLFWLTRDQRMVLWARIGEGWPWPRIVAFDAEQWSERGRQQRQLRNILADAEARILSRLNGTPGRMVIDPASL